MDQNNINNVGNNMQGEETVDSEFNILDYLRIALQYRFLIIGVFIIIVIANIIYTNRQAKIYQATGTVLLEGKTGNELFMLSSTSSSKKSINNTIVILKSKPVAALAYQILLKHPQADKLPITNSANPIGRMKNISASSIRDSDVLTLSYESTSPL
ncbi:MAG: hypothetical protein P9L91_06640, partial [Candidatus Zophobacter franzmannii]|nr:hypothetical protein [Candidatus Zophobacter franzmannii]